MQAIISLDIGTSSVRALVFDSSFKIRNIFQTELKSFYPQKGWVEQEPSELWRKSQNVLEKAANFAVKKKWEIKGIGITNQRETIIAWSKKTGRPVYRAIVWQDRRTAEFCEFLQKKGFTKKIYNKTGLRLDPYFSASKMRWILDNVAQTKKMMREGDLLFGTVDTWIIWNLTKGQKYLTDVSNASRTMLFNIQTLQWDRELLRIFRISKDCLPRAKPSVFLGNNFGLVEIAGQEIPILSICGDQTSALYGQECLKTGQAKSTYGTGGFVVVNIGTKAQFKNSKLITTLAWQINKEKVYALEGSIFQSGGSLKWLRDNLRLFKKYEEINFLSRRAKDSGGIYLVPAFVGLGSPHWLPNVSGFISGLNYQTQKGHLVNAAIEAAAFQVNDILEIIRKDYKTKISSLRVDGGLTKNKYLLQFQADMSGLLVEKAKEGEMTAQGVALMAGKVLGWKGKPFSPSEYYYPAKNSLKRKEKLKNWGDSLSRVC